ncbi:protein indeterminate-domain 16-like [Oryza brachyantha]|uniref:protein indeterminate-domain 16-like n=1 Tax=Oryza brachyantha TaxID=4533 RepID=UPI001ADD451F|nr:protein indeterminate-domain 16-like [Oryza brachyantha]
MLGSCAPTAGPPLPDEATTPEPFRSLQIATAAGSTKKKRRPAGTPDPDAEVVSLSPRTLLESDRYVCEICNQGFQRDQNLQMHRRRHKVPWKLLKREAGESARKRVFVCPEPTCLHHDPSHALGDLVGIKKHFRRKHSGHRQWACARCSKAYAVHSDYKAHLKTCGTRGHSCDCGRVFSRVESFIEHQDTCNASRGQAAAAEAGNVSTACGVAVLEREKEDQQAAAAAVSLSRTASSTSPSSDVVVSPVAWPGAPAMPSPKAGAFRGRFDKAPSPPSYDHYRGGAAHSLELQLMPPFNAAGAAPGMGACYYAAAAAHQSTVVSQGNDASTHLELSIGVCSGDDLMGAAGQSGEASAAVTAKEAAREQLRQAMAEKVAADEARAQARRQVELAEQELATARRMRHQAQMELSRAHALRDHAVRQVNATLLSITCFSCRHKFRAGGAGPPPAAMSSEVACSYVSSVVTEGGDADESLDVDATRRRLQHTNMDMI